jgi:hypothetical protein
MRYEQISSGYHAKPFACHPEPVRPSAANGPECSEGAQGKLREGSPYYGQGKLREASLHLQRQANTGILSRPARRESSE